MHRITLNMHKMVLLQMVPHSLLTVCCNCILLDKYDQINAYAHPLNHNVSVCLAKFYC